jgi:hypothetical protein
MKTSEKQTYGALSPLHRATTTTERIGERYDVTLEMNRPGFGGHPGPHEGAAWGVHGQMKAARVHERVQGADRAQVQDGGESIGMIACDSDRGETIFQNSIERPRTASIAVRPGALTTDGVH